MKQFEYENYADYKETQIATNLRKVDWFIGSSWVKRPELLILAQYILDNHKTTTSFNGICHGVRSGNEVNVLEHVLGWQSKVMGTDISHSANRFKKVIEWDFHDVKKEWLKTFDFVYSNAFDHAFDPEKALRAWMSCLNHKGTCYLHWSPENYDINKPNCFGADDEELYAFIESLGFVIADKFYTNVLENRYILAVIL